MGVSRIGSLGSIPRQGREGRTWMYDICEISATIPAADGEVMYKRTIILSPLVNLLITVAGLFLRSADGTGLSIESIVISNYSVPQPGHPSNSVLCIPCGLSGLLMHQIIRFQVNFAPQVHLIRCDMT